MNLIGKYINNPIERAQIPSSGILFSYFNLGHAYVMGTELELKKQFNKIETGLNVSYLYSRIVIGDEVETNKGTIRLKLFADQTPITVANFVNLAQKGYKIRFWLEEVKEAA